MLVLLFLWICCNSCDSWGDGWMDVVGWLTREDEDVVLSG